MVTANWLFKCRADINQHGPALPAEFLTVVCRLALLHLVVVRMVLFHSAAVHPGVVRMTMYRSALHHLVVVRMVPFRSAAVHPGVVRMTMYRSQCDFPQPGFCLRNLAWPNPDAAAVAMTSIRIQKTPISRAICLFGFISSSSIRIHTIRVYILQCDNPRIFYIQNMACVLIFTSPSQ